jgi:RNA polymerase sporulation-specific sigma factor
VATTQRLRLVEPRQAEQAGAAVASDLMENAPVVDLRESVQEPLRAVGGTAGAAPAPGCPCGCGETELIMRARSGDDAAVNELLDRYRVLARTKARSYFLVGSDRDDVVQEGMIGLYKAIRDFQPDKGASFRTFAELCVTRQIVTAVKGATRMKHAPLSTSISLDKPVQGDDGSTVLADLVPALASADPAAAVVSAEQMRALQRHFDEVLSDLEQQVLRHHVEGKSYEQIAAMLQRHVKSVDNALQRIKKKLQAHLDDREAG